MKDLIQKVAVLKRKINADCAEVIFDSYGECYIRVFLDGDIEEVIEIFVDIFGFYHGYEIMIENEAYDFSTLWAADNFELKL